MRALRGVEMNESYHESLDNARGKRQYLALGANALVEHGVRNLDLLTQIGWDALIALPSWCLLKSHELQTVQKTVGAVYLLPAAQSSVDGRVLKRFRASIGAPMFEKIFKLNPVSSEQILLDSEKDTEEQILRAGSSVLLGTIADPALLKMYFSLLGPPSVVLGREESEKMYKQACELIKITNTFDGKSVVEQASAAI